jgi:pyruvate,water dikinase
VRLLPFTDPSATQVAIAGGKGANLAALTQAGFPVPAGMIVTARESNRPMPPDLVAEIEAACATGHWAVRSSGTLEDTASAAFAGQHDTYLNCVGAADVIEHVRECWQSLWSPRAIAYRDHLGVGHDVSMAVVIQHMVFADVAGVAFSIDPVSGNLGHAVINANFGLGESVVSGEGGVDHLIVDKATGAIVEARIAEKTSRVVATDRGTVTQSAADPMAPALSPADVRQLVALLAKVEAHYGWPQDIEWALRDGKLWLLQSRPITTIPPRWTRDESGERFPNVVTPLTWDLVERGFHQSLNHSFALMGLPRFDGKWFACFDYYVYGNQNAVELYARRSPVSLSALSDLTQHLPALLQRFAWVQTLPGEWHAALPAYLESIQRFAAENIDHYAESQAWDYVQRVNTLGTNYFLPNIAISIGHAVLHRGLRAIVAMSLGEERAEDVTAAIVACDTMTAQVNRELSELAALAGTDEGAFRHHLVRFLRAHGHRETDFDAYHPTWQDAPNVVLDLIKTGLPVRDTARIDVDRAAAEDRLLAAVPAELKAFVEQIVLLAREYTALDDLEHYHTTRLAPLLRRGVRQIGVCLVRRGVIGDPLDAFFATADALRDPPSWVALGEMIKKAKGEYVRARGQTPAWVIGEEDVPPPADSVEWTGIPGSPGRATGPAYIVSGVNDFAGFPKGAVLVARTTNPAWTPLFYAAAAVVTETGGPLSHGAVTAREARIPAVMAVRDVLRSVKNGDILRVDGSTGRVYRET